MKSAFDAAEFVTRYGGPVAARYGPKHIVYGQGDPADGIFYLHTGHAQLKVASRQGKEAVIALVEPGEFCGERCLIGEQYRMSTVATVTECTLTRLEKASVVLAIKNDQSFAEFLVMYVLNRTMRLQNDLIDQMFNSSEKRLARVLLLLADHGQEIHGETVIDNINHQTLAQMVGTTRSRVNFFMNKFRQLGYIDYNGKLSLYKSRLAEFLHDQAIAEIVEALPIAPPKIQKIG